MAITSVHPRSYMGKLLQTIVLGSAIAFGGSKVMAEESKPLPPNNEPVAALQLEAPAKQQSSLYEKFGMLKNIVTVSAELAAGAKIFDCYLNDKAQKELDELANDFRKKNSYLSTKTQQKKVVNL